MTQPYILCILLSIIIGSPMSNINGQLPTTNIYALDLKFNEQIVLLKNLRFLTAFNHDGYNNQPTFISENELLIASDFKSPGTTDIWKLDVKKKKVTRMTRTDSGEYSPTIMSDGNNFSIIRQVFNADGSTPQWLWSYPLDLSNAGAQIIPDLDHIGYHIWITKDKLALYLVGEPSELVLYDMRNMNSTHIAYDVGRCLKIDKGGNLYYIQNSEELNVIRSYDIYLGRSRRITNAFPGQPDFDILPNGHLISAKGSQIMSFRPFIDREWKPILDLGPSGITGISRMASSSNLLTIVAANK